MATDTTKITGAADDLSDKLTKGGSAAKTLGSEIANAIKSIDDRVTKLEAGGTAPPITGTTKLEDAVKQNTMGQSEGAPHGVPTSWDWYTGKTAPNYCPADWTQITGWSQIYAMEGQPFVGGTFTIANQQCWIRNKATGVWSKVQDQATNKVYGSSYPGDFNGSSISWTFTTNADGSQQAATCQNGRNVHWYHHDRANFATNTYDHCFVQLDVKVSAANMNWVVNAGADWYPNSATINKAAAPPSAVQQDVVPGAGMGNWIKLTTGFRTSYLYTCTESELRANPPPPLR